MGTDCPSINCSARLLAISSAEIFPKCHRLLVDPEKNKVLSRRRLPTFASQNIVEGPLCAPDNGQEGKIRVSDRNEDRRHPEGTDERENEPSMSRDPIHRAILEVQSTTASRKSGACAPGWIKSCHRERAVYFPGPVATVRQRFCPPGPAYGANSANEVGQIN